MRLLVTIPHYFHPGGKADGRPHGSVARDPGPRIESLGRAVSALYGLFARPQCHFRFDTWSTEPANAATVGEVEVLILSARGHHLIDRLPTLAGPIWHLDLPVEPTTLGFECHAALRDRLGKFDYYAYLEDDLIVHDPWFLAKLAWFNGLVGDGCLLQPNRYEVSREGPVYKAYIDGDFAPGATAAYQDLAVEPKLQGSVLGRPVVLRRASNPHSGGFFLNASQMEFWASRPFFLDRDTSFVGPLESAATLGIMRAFRIYKPAPEVASFLEVEHQGTSFLHQIKADGRLK
jgi:hypothetical protein